MMNINTGKFARYKCPKCGLKLEYLSEFTRQGKARRFYCNRCGKMWIIDYKEMREEKRGGVII